MVEATEWEVVESDFGSPLVHPLAYQQALAQRLQPLIGVNDESFRVIGKGEQWFIAIDMPRYLPIVQRVLNQLEKPAFFERVDCESRQSIADIAKAGRAWRDADYSAYSNEELVSTYEGVFEKLMVMNTWGAIVNAVDLFHNRFSERLAAVLKRQIEKTGAALSVADCFATLLQPLELPPLSQQDVDFYRLLALVQSNPVTSKRFGQPDVSTPQLVATLNEFPELTNAIHAHARAYDWLQFHYDGPTILDMDYFVELLASEQRQGVRGSEKLAEQETKLLQLKRRQETVTTQLELSEADAYWFRVARTFGLLKLFRKDAVHQVSCWTDGLIREIARRLNLTAFDVRHLTVPEVRAWLVNHAPPITLAQVKERGECYVSYSNAQGSFIYSGPKAVEFHARVKRLDGQESQAGSTTANASAARELKGFAASPGEATGIVKLIIQASDMPKMNQGDILVSVATNPNLVPAMKKAAAIITDIGGITCHAAIVSRELSVPCIIATKVGTKTLKDGDRVHVNANTGIIRILSRS